MPINSERADQLRNTPFAEGLAMTSWVDYSNFAVELRDDICDRFSYPSLWAAIDRLTSFVEKYTRADVEMRNAGYTSDDAFAYKKMEDEEWNNAGPGSNTGEPAPKPETATAPATVPATSDRDYLDEVVFQLARIGEAQAVLDEALQYAPFNGDDGITASKLISAALDIQRQAIPKAENLTTKLCKQRVARINADK